MPWPYPGSKQTERCPCCDKEVMVYGWETFIMTLALESTSYWGDKQPPRVRCVDQQGKAVRAGYAVTIRFHDGPIDVGVLRRPGDWKHGWWWPLGRVLWDIQKEAASEPGAP